MRLHFLLSALTSVLLVALFAAFGLYLADHQAEQQLQDIRHEAASLAHHVSDTVAPALLDRDFARLEQPLLRIAGGHPELLALQVADATGTIVASVRIGPEDHPYPARDDLNAAIATGGQTARDPGAHVLLTPLVDNPTLGQVRVVASLASVARTREAIRAQFLGAGLLAALLASGLLTLLLRPSTRALERAAGFAAELASRHGDHLASSCKVRELRQLDQALNRASRDLHAQHLAVHEAESRKSAIMAASLDALITMDKHCVIIDANPAAEQIFASASGGLIGHTLRELLAEDQTEAQTEPHPCLASLLESGRCPLSSGCAVLNQRIEIQARRLDGQGFQAEMTLVPFEHEQQAHYLASLRDITQRKWMELEQRNITTILHNTVNELAAQQFALDEHAIVSITDLEGNILYANEKFERISQYRLPELIGKNHRLLKSGLHPPAFYADIWATIASGVTWHGLIINRRKDGSLYWVDSTIVPVLDDNRLPRQYLSIRTDVTELQRARIALDQARSQEIAIGNQIQRTLLFGRVPRDLGSLSLCVHTEPSQGIDGDFYEFFNYREGRFDIAIGDVMGKGVSAALMGAAVKQQMNQVIAEQLARDAGDIPDPAVLVNALHDKVTRQLIDLDSFITLDYLGVDLDHGQVHFVDAGHPPAILAGRDGVRHLSGDNLPLGVLATEHYRQATLPFLPGDLICLYSDGLTEAKSGAGEEFGIERLTRLVEVLHGADLSATLITEAIRAEIDAFCDDSTLQDDRSVIVLRNRASAEPGRAIRDFDLPWHLDSLTALHDAVRQFAEAAGLASARIDALVLASFEAGSNIVRHGQPRLKDARIHCELESDAHEVRVRLSCLGKRFDPPPDLPDFSGDRDGGFGLYIIHNAVDDACFDHPAPGVCRLQLSQQRH